MQVANPRNNNVTNVALEVTGEGISNSGKDIHRGSCLRAKIPVNLTITPEKETTA